MSNYVRCRSLHSRANYKLWIDEMKAAVGLFVSMKLEVWSQKSRSYRLNGSDNALRNFPVINDIQIYILFIDSRLNTVYYCSQYDSRYR